MKYSIVSLFVLAPLFVSCSQPLTSSAVETVSAVEVVEAVEPAEVVEAATDCPTAVLNALQATNTVHWYKPRVVQIATAEAQSPKLTKSERFNSMGNALKDNGIVLTELEFVSLQQSMSTAVDSAIASGLCD
jgi:hypothetical protein